ncbi:cytochrome c oxidase subunit 7A1, mitochondrial-like [Lytechinus variegatus]|uniref:cytochrome c oxidase subunit 7A1, mitochondrial-like n=1 Tax=Lytechinus variegatus TaxID=7654 RepID=UPI001BB11CFB|nr:cytochrome c oxidase subunit 7A1, mitochondrial-like [Lytechinus variegatus]
MAFKHNSASGKVSSADPLSAYNPGGLTQTKIKETPPIEFAQKPAPSGTMSRFFKNKVAFNQARFGTPDGLPVHIKLGRDRITFAFAMGLTAVGTIWSCYSLFKLSFKK